MTKTNLIWIFAIFILLTSGLVSATTAGWQCSGTSEVRCSALGYFACFASSNCAPKCYNPSYPSIDGCCASGYNEPNLFISCGDKYHPLCSNGGDILSGLTCPAVTQEDLCTNENGCSWLYNGGGSSYDCTSPDAYLYDLISCSSTSSINGTTCDGTKQCLSTGWSSTCQNSITEVCNNIDDDCNNIVDDNAVCPSGQTCVSGTCTGTCSPLKEICNDKIDNDCDGKIDAEDSLPLTSSDTSYCAVGVRLFNPLTYQYQTYPCGVEDGVCPEHFTDASGNKVNCTAFFKPDEDCLPRVEMRCGDIFAGGSILTEKTCVDPAPISAKNCPSATDCVYKNSATETAACYAYDRFNPIQIQNADGKQIECDANNYWCPKDFNYLPSYNRCELATDYCDRGNIGQTTYSCGNLFDAQNKINPQLFVNCTFNSAGERGTAPYSQYCDLDQQWDNYQIYMLKPIIVK